MKKFDPATIARENILQLKPYNSARSEFNSIASIYLDANENTLGSATGKAYNRYPDPLQQELKLAVARLKNILPQQIFIGNGSDEPIDLLLRTFCKPGEDNIIVCPPTYGMYEVAARINDIAIQEIPLTKCFQLDVTAILAAINTRTKLVFICTPNNPTGNSINAADIREIVNIFNGIVVIDEAYIDFSEEASWMKRLDEHSNIVVLQTFSKAWGAAALRIGTAFTSTAIIGLLNKVKPPYNINAASQQLLLEAVRQKETVTAWIAIIRQQRTQMQQRLQAFSFVKNVYPSDANFLLVKFTDAASLYEHLLKNGIVVRRRDSMYGCDNCLRITIGSPTENEALYTALETFKA